MASGSKTKTTQQATSTTTPQAPSFISDPWKSYAADASSFGATPPQATPASALQNQAFAAASAGGPVNLRPGLLADADLSKYMNPYTESVINSTVGDLTRSKDKMIAQGQAAATAAGSYGGSRHGVADSLIGDDFLRTLGSTVDNLRQAGFDKAQQGAQFDIGNRFAADQFNVGAERDRISQLASLGATQRDIDQDMNPDNIKLKQLLARAGLLGAIPANLFTGQTVNSSGSGTSSSDPGLAGLIGGAAGLASGVGALGGTGGIRSLFS